jgi:DNA mismatch repair protein MutL
MERDDAVLSFERHATSKIRTLEDLGRIGTLGFRGEALASIASVAKVELLTKPDAATIATKVVIEAGRLVDVKDAARTTGTTIAVRDLFFNTPARRKFMRSEATENYHLTNIVTHYALAHPQVAFTLSNNGREVLRVSPAKDLRERAFQIFGSGLLESLLPVSGGREFVAKVSGFISAPRERRTTRDAQYFFVNQRFVRDRTIAGGLIEGYRSVLPHGVYPIAFLFVDIPPEEIDVNVHPAKTEVRFRRTEAVKEAIAEAVRDALSAAGIVTESAVAAVPTVDHARVGAHIVPEIEVQQPRMDFAAPGPAEHETIVFETNGSPVREPISSGVIPSAGLGSEPSPALDFEVGEFESSAAARVEGVAYDSPLSSGTAAGELIVETPVALPPFDSAVRTVKPAEVVDVSTARIKPIAQLHESFIIAVDDEGMLLIDQHVAHERILFDKFRHREGARQVESQNLLLPETFDLSPAQAEAFNLVEEYLSSIGFQIMRLSGRTVAIKSVPTDLPAGETRNLFAEVLDAVVLDKRGSAKATFRDDVAASLACKAAIKINMKLTPEKMQWLVDKLLETSSPTTCPHGRPVILRLTMKDIERSFHRT